MKEYFLPQRTLMLWRIRLCVVFVPSVAACIPLGPLFFAVAAVILLAAFLYLLYFYLPRFHKSYKMEFGEGYMDIICGVFIKTEKILPTERIISVRVSSGPLSRRLSLAALSVSAVHFKLRLAPLDHRSAEIIKEFLGGDSIDLH